MTDSAADFDPAFEPADKADRNRRRREIAQLVFERGRVTVDEIKERFGVSGVTARGDLDALAGSGNLVRSHGGAVSTLRPSANGAAAGTNSDERIRLAHAAIALIGSSETVMICPGGATIEMAKLMRTECPQSVTVITYSLQIASLLSEAPQVSLIMLGGLHRYPSGNFVGPHAEQMLKSLHARHCFLNTPGMRAETGVTTTDIMEAHLNQNMLEAASQVTLLAELASFGERSLALIADLDKINRVICDRSAPAADLAALRERGVEIVPV